MVSRPSLVLRNVSVPGGRTADITITDGHVSHTGAALPAERILDCTGLFVLPAAVDMHVHMRGGRQSVKEDWGSGSRSALAGGVTVVVDQPNTIPPLTTPDTLRARVLEAKSGSLCHFAINSGVTHDTPLKAMWSAGAMAFGETFFGPSSYGDAITPQELTSALGEISRLGALATIHAEEIVPSADESLVSHDRARPAAGELRAIGAVRSCNTAGCRLHFCHMSTKSAVEAATGSVEVTPHHLFLSLEQPRTPAAFCKVNPPIRTEKERKDLWSVWERIDVIASDHAPHTRSEKEQPFAAAPSGIPGVETMVPLLMAEVLNRKISLQDVIRKTSMNPASLLGITSAGFSAGDRGDFALYPKGAAPVDPDHLHSKCGWTPFEGLPAVSPRLVVMGGVVVYEEGEFSPGNPLWLAGNGFFPP